MDEFYEYIQSDLTTMVSVKALVYGRTGLILVHRLRPWQLDQYIQVTIGSFTCYYLYFKSNQLN